MTLRKYNNHRSNNYWYLLLLMGLLLINAIGFTQPLLSVTANSTSSCDNDGTITLTISGGISPYHIIVRNSRNSIVKEISSTNLTSHTINNVPDGSYWIYVEGSGNSDDGSTWINVASKFNVAVTTTAESCSDDGSMTANPSGGTAPYTYLWSNGAITQTVSNINAGNYRLVVTDANGCKNHDRDSIFVMDKSTLNLSISSTPKSCAILGTATVNATGGAAPYSYFWNTDPVQTTPAIANLATGYYAVTVTDANGCKDRTSIYVGNDNNSLTLTSSYTEENCNDSDGTATVYNINGTAPFTYLWNNGQNTKTATNLSRGWYSVKVTDANSCESIASVFVTDKTPLTVNFNFNTPACKTKNGSITANVNGGVPPYIYRWNTDAVSSSINGLEAGGYSVVVTDAVGCSKQAWFYLSASSDCKAYISGIAYNDENGNCVQDIGEFGISGAHIKLSNGWSAITSMDGYYSFIVDPGNYTISQEPPMYYSQTCPVSSFIMINANTPGVYSANNFANKPTAAVVDLGVEVYCGAPRPGFTRNSTLIYANNGTVPASGKIVYTFDGPWDYAYASPVPNNYNPITRTAEWNIPVKAGKKGFIYIYMSVDPSVQLGIEVSCAASVSTASNDVVALNDKAECGTSTVGSYDPNDLQVFPKGKEEEGYISSEDILLTYLIRFQNTGTDTAYTVIVKDTLDINLNKGSIHSVSSSHPCVVDVKGNVLEFTFNDIDLLDSTFNEKKSHGFVLYKIKRDKTMQPGEVVKNKSDIYFDYNPPIGTNSVKNTISLGVDNILGNKNENTMDAYPVPFNDQLSLSFTKALSGSVEVRVITLNGEDLGSLAASISTDNKALDLKLSGLYLSPGIYIIKVISNENVFYKKVVKAR